MRQKIHTLSQLNFVLFTLKGPFTNNIFSLLIARHSFGLICPGFEILVSTFCCHHNGNKWNYFQFCMVPMALEISREICFSINWVN